MAIIKSDTIPANQGKKYRSYSGKNFVEISISTYLNNYSLFDGKIWSSVIYFPTSLKEFKERDIGRRMEFVINEESYSLSYFQQGLIKKWKKQKFYDFVEIELWKIACSYGRESTKRGKKYFVDRMRDKFRELYMASKEAGIMLISPKDELPKESKSWYSIHAEALNQFLDTVEYGSNYFIQQASEERVVVNKEIEGDIVLYVWGKNLHSQFENDVFVSVGKSCKIEDLLYNRIKDIVIINMDKRLGIHELPHELYDAGILRSFALTNCYKKNGGFDKRKVKIGKGGEFVQFSKSVKFHKCLSDEYMFFNKHEL